MTRQEFIKLVKYLHPKITEIEADHIARHFDKGSKGFILKSEFVGAFDEKVKDQAF